MRRRGVSHLVLHSGSSYESHAKPLHNPSCPGSKSPPMACRSCLHVERELRQRWSKPPWKMRLAKRRFLVDVNVILALPDLDQVHHVAALRRLNQAGGGDWGTFIFTESGFIRITSKSPHSAAAICHSATSILALMTQQLGHRFSTTEDSWNALTDFPSQSDSSATSRRPMPAF